MRWTHVQGGVIVGLVSAGMAACTVEPAEEPGPVLPPQYVALPDTLVCVIDRAAPSGLASLPAKIEDGGVVVFADGRVSALEEVHPVSMIAGYAGREAWLTRGDPVPFSGASYVRTGGERRIGIELLDRVGEHEGILLFAGLEDPPPADALYIPTSPGCIFQAYVREDLIQP
jgi:hypothetical protein